MRRLVYSYTRESGRGQGGERLGFHPSRLRRGEIWEEGGGQREVSGLVGGGAGGG